MEQRLEDIYPLTIVGMRHGKFAVIEADNNCDCVSSLQGDEEWQYNPEHYMSENWEHIRFGVGKTIAEAFQNFIRS